MSGTAPLSFLYVKPTFALFDKSVVCDRPVPPALPSTIDLEYDQGSYYVQLHAALVLLLKTLINSHFYFDNTAEQEGHNPFLICL